MSTWELQGFDDQRRTTRCLRSSATCTGSSGESSSSRSMQTEWPLAVTDEAVESAARRDPRTGPNPKRGRATVVCDALRGAR